MTTFQIIKLDYGSNVPSFNVLYVDDILFSCISSQHHFKFHLAAMADVRLERQLRYYFSDKNLWKDVWLVKQLGDDCTGFIAAEVIAGFNRVQQITSEVDLVVASLKRIEELEVKEDSQGDLLTNFVRKKRQFHKLCPGSFGGYCRCSLNLFCCFLFGTRITKVMPPSTTNQHSFEKKITCGCCFSFPW